MALALMVLLSLPLTAAARPAILVMGDSLSAAYGIDTQQGWVNLLRKRLDKQGYRYKVVNASISGETSSGGLERLPAALEKHQPEVVILELGANDGLQADPPTHIRRNLLRMIELCRAHGAKVLLLGVRLPPNYGRAYIDRFLAVFKTVAEQDNIAFVPRMLAGIAKHRDLMQQGGLHPIARAEPKVLHNIWPELKPMLGF